MERGYINITEEEIGKPIVEVKIVNGGKSTQPDPVNSLLIAPC